MGQLENNQIGKLFLLFGAIIFYSTLFIESLVENPSYFFKLIILAGIITYSAIFIIHLLAAYYTNSKINKMLKNKSLIFYELLMIIIFGIMPFLSFLQKIY